MAESGKFEQYDEKAKASLERAHRYQTTLDVLKEIEEMPNHYTTSLTL